VNAASLNTLGVGLTTLAAGSVEVEVSAAGFAANLGALDGAADLTVRATNDSGDLRFRAADLGSLTVDDADDVTFFGAFETSGVVDVDTNIGGQVAVGSSGSVARPAGRCPPTLLT